MGLHLGIGVVNTFLLDDLLILLIILIEAGIDSNSDMTWDSDGEESFVDNSEAVW